MAKFFHPERQLILDDGIDYLTVDVLEDGRHHFYIVAIPFPNVSSPRIKIFPTISPFTTSV